MVDDHLAALEHEGRRSRGAVGLSAGHCSLRRRSHHISVLWEWGGEQGRDCMGTGAGQTMATKARHNRGMGEWLHTMPSYVVLCTSMARQLTLGSPTEMQEEGTVLV